MPFHKSSNTVSVVLTILYAWEERILELGQERGDGGVEGWGESIPVNSKAGKKLSRRCDPRTLVSDVLCSTFSLCLNKKFNCIRFT